MEQCITRITTRRGTALGVWAALLVSASSLASPPFPDFAVREVPPAEEPISTPYFPEVGPHDEAVPLPPVDASKTSTAAPRTMRHELAAPVPIDAAAIQPDVASGPVVPSGAPTELAALRERLSTEPLIDVPIVSDGWWDQFIVEPLRSDVTTLPLTLEQTLVRTLHCSHQVRVFSELPLIRETAITEADAAFDWTAFLESRWRDLSDPVGSTLTAGPGVTRYQDHHYTFSGGVRKKTITGAQIEGRQDFGFQDTNSTFFVPDPQGTSRIALSFTQPLMRGRGEIYNTSLICLAGIDTEIARDEFMRQLQSHLLEVTRAYWALHLERGVLYQKLNSYRRALEVVQRLDLRRALDASETQVRAARAALTERRSELMRAEAAVRNAESRLRALVNDPEFGQFDTVELVPLDMPTCQLIPVDMHLSLGEAMMMRPEVSQSLKQIRAAAVRLQMADNELLPLLNLVAETYVAGLAGNGNVGVAWGNQFDQGQPGYSVGLQFEVPLGNRAAKARYQRRQVELRQLQSQYQVTLQTVGLEVEVAVREVETSQKELLAKAAAVEARKEQLSTLEQRWERLPQEDLTATLVLENILTAQDRLAEAEFGHLQSQVTYNLSLTNLKRATGSLLQHELVSIERYCQCGVPAQTAVKPEIVERHIIAE
ncbi:MAG: TolC family protein [Planctomycetaceae bacterium]|nr:TolC family protein [Planctomycetaceae bacterium]